MPVSPKLLIVENNPAQRRQLTKISEEEGFAVIRCSSSQRALEVLWENADVAAVIVNTSLADISSTDLFRQVQANPSLKRLPVLTTYGTFTSDRVSCLVSPNKADNNNSAPEELREILFRLARSHRAAELNKDSGTIFLGCTPG